ncbi:major facilitator superfamily domain-containing protein [Chytridium lagenaria]|nr:major facilitator superfamily domain-containing protein [Chytridium lagenaria]
MYTLFSSIPAIVATPIVGVLGDRVGRRPVVILSALALWVNIASVVAVGRGFPFFVIFIGAFICGACGNWQAMILGMSSYISDSASPDLRTQFFSLSDALGTSAALIAPFIGGQAAVQFGPVGSFYLSLFIQTLVALYVIFIVPESLNFGVSERTGQAAGTSSEEEVATKKLNWGDAAWFALSSAFKSIATLRGRSRTLLAVFLFLGDCINAGLGGYIALFFMLRFGWTTGDVGEKRKGSRGGGGGEEGGNSGDNTFEETRARFGFDMGLVRIGLVLMAIGYAALGIAPEGWMLYFIYTNARGVLSRCTPPDEQGRLFAAINVIAAIGSTVGDAATVTTMPSAMLFVMSAYAVVVLVVLSFVKKDELAHLATAASSSRSEEVETS